MGKKIFAVVLVLCFLAFSGCAPENSSSNSSANSSKITSSSQSSSNNSSSNLSSSSSSVSSSNSSSNVSSSPAVLKHIGDYYPFEKNIKYSYEGSGNEYASYTIFVDYISATRIQLRVNNGGTEAVKVLQNSGDQLKMLLNKGECYYRENMLNKSNDSTDILLQEPLQKGTQWTVSNNRTRYISDVDVSINTPSGTYKALEVTTNESQNSKTLDYYAEGVGLVKTIYVSNGTEVSSSLKSREENTSFVQTVRFYYPNSNVDGIYYIDKQIEFNTNDITRFKLEAAYKDITDSRFAKVLTENTKIRSLYLNADGNVYVDFSKQLITEMNAGSGYEMLILQSFTNTFGNYYGAKKVYATIENSPYSSGHILLEKGQFLTVNFDNCVAAQ